MSVIFGVAENIKPVAEVKRKESQAKRKGYPQELDKILLTIYNKIR